MGGPGTGLEHEPELSVIGQSDSIGCPEWSSMTDVPNMSFQGFQTSFLRFSRLQKLGIQLLHEN